MSSVEQHLAEAERKYQQADAHFENAYIAYKLAGKYLDEIENWINELRAQMDEESAEEEE